MSSGKRYKLERMYALLDEPEKFEELCDDVANGATLVDVARRWEVPYSRLHLWIFSPAYPEREKAYNKAMKARGLLYTETVLSRLMSIGGAVLAKCYDEKGRLLPVHRMPEEAQRAVKSVEMLAGGVQKVTMLDPVAALQLIGKQHHMFGSDVSVSVSGKITHEIAKAVSIADLTDAELAEVRSGEISSALLARLTANAAADSTTKSGG